MGDIIFFIGGARSGKSAYALELGSRIHGRKAFLATAEAFDDEMSERIAMHRKNRPVEWETIEEPLAINERLRKIDDVYDIVIIDCLTLWLSNMIGKDEDSDQIRAEIELLAATMKDVSYNSIVVSNEVGQGIVPENKVARLFRDLNGWINRRIASIADEVYIVTCGIPLKIK